MANDDAGDRPALQPGNINERELLEQIDFALQGSEAAASTLASLLADLAHGIRPSPRDISDRRATCSKYQTQLTTMRALIAERLEVLRGK